MGFSMMICIFMVVFNQSSWRGLQIFPLQSSEDLPVSTFLGQQMMWDLNHVVFSIRVKHIRTSSHPELFHFTDTICFLCLNQFVFHFKSCALCSAFWPCKSISCTACNKYFPEIWMNYVNNFIFINSAMHWNDPNTFVIHDLLLTKPSSFPFY